MYAQQPCIDVREKESKKTVRLFAPLTAEKLTDMPFSLLRLLQSWSSNHWQPEPGQQFCLGRVTCVWPVVNPVFEFQ